MQEQIEKIKQELNRRKLKQSSLAAEYRKLTNEQIVDGEGTEIEKAFKRQAGAREALEWVLSVLQPNEYLAPPLQQAAVMRSADVQNIGVAILKKSKEMICSPIRSEVVEVHHIVSAFAKAGIDIQPNIDF